MIEAEERWTHNGNHWYCRAMFWAAVKHGRISDLSVYCTGDWDQAREQQHANSVRLLRP